MHESEQEIRVTCDTRSYMYVCACVCMCLVKREGEREVASTKVALYRKTIRTFAPAGWHVRIRLTPLIVSPARIFGCSPFIVSFAPVCNDV